MDGNRDNGRKRRATERNERKRRGTDGNGEKRTERTGTEITDGTDGNGENGENGRERSQGTGTEITDVNGEETEITDGNGRKRIRAINLRQSCPVPAAIAAGAHHRHSVSAHILRPYMSCARRERTGWPSALGRIFSRRNSQNFFYHRTHRKTQKKCIADLTRELMQLHLAHRTLHIEKQAP
jgi:hypothetical protein